MFTLNANTVTANANKNALRALCKKHNIKNYGKMNNAQMRAAVNQKLAVGTMFKQAVKQVTKAANVVTTPVNSWVTMLTPTAMLHSAIKKVQAQPQKQAVKKQPVQNGQWKPKRGGKTYAVWVQMRYALAVKKLPLKQAKTYVRDHFINTDVHFNTVNAQIYRFCKYYGLCR